MSFELYGDEDFSAEEFGLVLLLSRTWISREVLLPVRSSEEFDTPAPGEVPVPSVASEESAIFSDPE